MAIVHLGAKRLQGTKLDRKVDSLGSDADGTNSGITLVSGKEITWTSSGSTTTFNSVTKSASSAGWTNNYAHSQSYSSGILIVEFDPNVGQGYGSLCGIDDGTNNGDPTDITLGMAGLTQATNNNTIISGTATDQGSGSWASGDIMKIEYNIDSGAYAFYKNGSAIGVSGTLTGGAKPSSVRVLVSSYNQNYKVTDIAISGSATTSTDTVQKLGTGAYSFDGSNDYTSFGEKSQWDFLNDDSTDFNISFWLKNEMGTVSSNKIWFSTYADNQSDGILLQIRTGSGGGNNTFRVHFSSNSANTNTGNTFEDIVPSASTWHHYSVNYDKTTKVVEVFKDGTSQGTHTVSAHSYPAADQTLHIGARQSDGNFCNIDLDDMGIYKRKLTATEIGKLANNNVGGFSIATFNNTSFASYDSANNEIDFEAKVNSSQQNGAFAIDMLGQTVSDTKWTMRMKVNFSNIGGGNGSNISFNIAKNGHTTSNATAENIFGWAWGEPPTDGGTGSGQNYIGFRQGTDSSGASSSNYPNTTSGSGSTSWTNKWYTNGWGDSAENTDYYIELARTSATEATFKVWTGSYGGTQKLSGSVNDIPSGTDDLRYFKFCNRSNDGQPRNGNTSGALKELSFWNGTNDTTETADYTQVVGDAQLVSSLTNKSELKANYTMDTITTINGSPIMNILAYSGATNFIHVGDSYKTRGEKINASDSALVGYKVSSVTVTIKDYDGNGLTGNLTCTILDSSGNAVSGDSFPPYNTAGLTSTESDVTFTNSNPTRVLQDDDSIALYYNGDATHKVGFKRSDAGDAFDGTKTCRAYRTGTSGALGVEDTEDHIMKIVTAVDGCKNDASSTSDLEAMTNLPTNTIFEQTDDTPSYWWYNGTSWLLDGSFATYTDDLTSDKGWTSNTSDWTYNASDYLDFATIRRSTTSQEMYIDVQEKYGVTLDSSKWTLRLGKFTTGALASSGNVMFFFGLTNDKDADSGQTQQSVLANLNFSPSEGGIFLYCTTGNLESGSNRVTGTVYDGLVASTDYWIEISRDGDVFTAKAYSDEYSTEIGSKSLTKTGISGLRYLKVLNDSEQNGNTATGTKLYGKIEIANGKAGWLS